MTGIGSLATVTASTFGFGYLGFRLACKIGRGYLASILRQNVAFYDHTGVGEISTRMAVDVNAIGRLIRKGRAQYNGPGNLCDRASHCIYFVLATRTHLALSCRLHHTYHGWYRENDEGIPRLGTGDFLGR